MYDSSTVKPPAESGPFGQYGRLPLDLSKSPKQRMYRNRPIMLESAELKRTELYRKLINKEIPFMKMKGYAQRIGRILQMMVLLGVSTQVPIFY